MGAIPRYDHDMRKAMHSLGHAWEGLLHAFVRERNFRLFCIGYAILLSLGYFLRLSPAEWVAVLISGGIFLITELLNTALERLVDAVDELRKTEPSAVAYHTGLKATKDTAAAASLVSLIFFGCVAVIVFLPYIVIF